MLAGAQMLREARAMAMTGEPITGKRSIDVHTHVYLPRYVEMLRARANVPRVIRRNGADRLLILPGKDEEDRPDAGRPFGGEYWQIGRKLAFMDRHDIAMSVLSLANPWLEFLPPAEATPFAAQLNEDMERLCAESGGRLYGFGVLPMRDPPGCVQELRRISRLPHLRGVILGTSGLGNGLDDPALDQVWAEAEAQQAMIFIHPHYGLGNDAYTGTGHALFLALGFTFETTTAVARLILRGTFDRFPKLKLLIAHAGGTLPYLAGRLDSCVETERQVDFKLREPPSAYLKRLYYDAIAYHTPSLRGLIEFVGADRIMFGTDHPFFPPHDPPPDLDRALWPSPRENYAAIAGLRPEEQPALLRENARRILALPA